MATYGKVLVKILQNYGIDTIFGIPGVHIKVVRPIYA
jgi:thiamine pyrophosphate-dependent acetolactate synthase large subunit-like protein